MMMMMMRIKASAQTQCWGNTAERKQQQSFVVELVDEEDVVHTDHDSKG
jgi:hypothetical protein